MPLINLETCSEEQFKKFSKARPKPSACDECWDRWEEKMSECDPSPTDWRFKQ